MASLAAGPLVANWKDAVHLAAMSGCVEAVDIVLSKLGTTAELQTAAAAALRNTCAAGNMSLVERLLLHWRCDAGVRGACGAALVIAAENGQLEVVERLLLEHDEEFDSAISRAAAPAAGGGHLAVLERLMADPRIDPAGFAAAMREACHGGYVHVVSRLLAEPNLKIKRGSHALLALAARRSHVDVLHELLADPRVDAEAYLQRVLKSDRRDLMTLPACYALITRPSAVRLLLTEATEKDPRFPRAYGSRDVVAW